MKYFAFVALLGLSQVNAIARFQPQGVTFLEENEAVQIGDDYPYYMNGWGGYHTYERDVPERFMTEEDDLLMRSMYDNYATEGQNEDTHMPDGNFWLTEDNAKRASIEVAGTHLKLKGKAAESYVNKIFPALWARFDVNEEGKIEIDRAPVFLRQICGNAEACVAL